MFWKKDEKLETLKDLVGSRAAYIETVKMLSLEGEEKDIFLRASIEIKKNKPDKEIIDKAYAILIAKSYQGVDANADEEQSDIEIASKDDIQDNIIIELLKEQIGTSQLFMEFINKYTPSQEERAILSGANHDLKSEPYDMNRAHAAYEIIKKYTNQAKISLSKPTIDRQKERTSVKLCQECGAEVDENAQFCSNCGASTNQKKATSYDAKNISAQKQIKTTSGTKKYVILFVLVLLGAGILYRYLGTSDSTPHNNFISSDTEAQTSPEPLSNDAEEKQNDNQSYKVGDYTIESTYDDIKVYIIERERDEYYGNAARTYDFEQECSYYEGGKDYKGRYTKVSTYNYPLASAELDFEYAKKYKEIKYRIRCTLGTKTNGALKPYYGELLPERYSKDEVQYAIERNCISLPRKICSPEPYNTEVDFAVNYHKFLQVMREHKQ